MGFQAGLELVSELAAFGVDLTQLPGDAGDHAGEHCCAAGTVRLWASRAARI